MNSQKFFSKPAPGLLAVVLLTALTARGATRGSAPAKLFSPAAAPLYFEENRGQAPGTAQFIARGRDCNLLLSTDSAEILLGQHGAALHSLRLVLDGANPRAALAGVEPLPGKANYLVGSDPAAWHTGVPLFGRIRAEEIYPGVGVTYYADPTARLEYDFVLQPGAAAGRIALRVEGADRVQLDATGELVLTLAGVEVRQHSPVIYQEVNGVRKTVAGGYRLTGANKVGFWLADYDHALPLVIDPTLSFSTFLGGEFGDQGLGIATDQFGNIFVTGETLSKTLRTNAPPTAFQTNFQGGSYYFGDAFVAKFDTSNHLAYLTYLGGRGQDEAFGIAVDNLTDEAVITGFTDSTNFPIWPTNAAAHAFQTHIGGTNNYIGRIYLIDAFVTKLSADGASLVYSTYLGGNARDVGLGVAVDAMGCAYVTGYTESTNFPTTHPLQGMYARYNTAYLTNVPNRHYVPVTYFTNYYGSLYHGGGDGFVAKLGPFGTNLIYSTYLGGTNLDLGAAIAVDANGQASVVGTTVSTNFPIVNPFSTAAGWLNGTNNYFYYSDAFVCKLDAAGTNLIFSSYLGGFDQDSALAVAADSVGATYVTGYTISTNYPVSATNFMAWTSLTNRNADVFVTKFNPDGTTNYSVKFGGSAGDQGNAIAVDASFNAYIAGASASTNSATNFWPAATAPDGKLSLTNRSYIIYGTNDVFVAELNPAGSAFLFYSYLGSSGNDQANGIALDPVTGNVCIVGTTTWTNFPTLHPVQPRSGNRLNSSDAFVGRIQLP